MRRALVRLLVVSAFLAIGAVTLGARCIERTHVYVDKEGYTHLTGDMHNDTNVQGSALIVRGTLYDAAGNVIAEKDSPICPPDIQPNSQVMFDIRFDNPGIPPPASHSARVVAGKSLDAPLPDADVVVLGTDAIRFLGFPPSLDFPNPDEWVFFRFDVRNRSPRPYTLQSCAAVYNNYGQVIATDAGEVVQIDEDGNVSPAVLGNQFRTSIFVPVDGVPPSAAYVRAWLWFGDKTDTTSEYRFIMTPIITIQTDTFP